LCRASTLYCHCPAFLVIEGVQASQKDQSEVPMANKEDFTPEQWTKILESMMLVGVAISAAEPSGPWGTLKEFFANCSAIANSKLDAGSDELVEAAVADFETSEGRSNIQKALRGRFADAEAPADIVQRSLASLREVSVILDAKAPGDAAAFKAWLCGISQKVAEAAAEGTFLGFGGVQVSDAEKATLADIAKALGTTA
jgi:hypothetical protein